MARFLLVMALACARRESGHADGAHATDAHDENSSDDIVREAGLDAGASDAPDERAKPMVLATGGPLPTWDGLYPYRLTIDKTYVYYADGVLGAGWVWRVPKAGGKVEVVIPLVGADAVMEYCDGNERASDLVFDGADLFWVGCGNRLRRRDPTTGTITRIGMMQARKLAADETRLFGTFSDTDGKGWIVAADKVSGATTTLASYLGDPDYLVVDSSRVFWTDFVDGTVRAVPKSGGDIVILAKSAGPQGIVVDDSYVYWTSAGDGTINRVAKGGGDRVVLVSGQSTPVGIARDETRLYWTNAVDFSFGAIMSAPLGGGSAVHLVDGLDGPFDIEVDEEAVYWNNLFGPGAGAIMKVAKQPS